MIKKSFLNEINKRLSNDIILVDSLNFEISEDEYLGILSWIKFLNTHISYYGFKERIKFNTPIVSKRILLDLAFYNIKDEEGKYCIYLKSISEKSTNKTINTYSL